MDNLPVIITIFSHARNCPLIQHSVVLISTEIKLTIKMNEIKDLLVLLNFASLKERTRDSLITTSILSL
jgi:hypothetical protein